MTAGTDVDPIELVAASTAAHYEQAQPLFVELMAWDCACVEKLGLDAALAGNFYYGQGARPLPDEFAPPCGLLLLAMEDGNAVGCGAISEQGPGTCELKRVYVRSEYRGKKLGRRLVLSLMDRARRNGYELMRLETVTFMRSAIEIYREIGFRERAPYYEIPTEFRDITLFMEIEL